VFATTPALPIPCTAQISCLSKGAPLISTDPMISPAAHRPLPQQATENGRRGDGLWSGSRMLDGSLCAEPNRDWDKESGRPKIEPVDGNHGTSGVCEQGDGIGRHGPDDAAEPLGCEIERHPKTVWPRP